MKPRISSLAVCCVVGAAIGCGEPLSVEPAPETGTPGLEFSHSREKPFEQGEKQPVVDLKRGFTYAIYPPGAGQNLTQTFSPPKNQKLGYIEIPVGCASGVLLNVKIREGIGGPILSESNVSGLPAVVDGSFQLIQVYDPAVSHGIKIRKNETYAIELSAFPTGNEQTCGLAPGPAGDSYADGAGFFEDVPTNGPGWVPLPGGEDLPFITLVN